MNNRISAIFETREGAERAIAELRALGITERHLSVIARHHDEHAGGGGGAVAERHVTAAEEAALHEHDHRFGLGAGIGWGALFGLAWFVIPGVGPFLAAGSLAAGIAAGVAAEREHKVARDALEDTPRHRDLHGALGHFGYRDEEASHYGPAIERGGFLVTIQPDESGVTDRQVMEILHRHGGRTAPGSAWI